MSKYTALLVVDVQEELFLPHKNLYKGDELLSNIKLLIEKAHQTQTSVIYIQHTQNDDGPMVKGKPGWQLHHQLTPMKDEKVILKYNPDSFQDTILQQVLSSMNINKLIITGLMTEYCIDTTCRRAYSLGYKTTLVKDGHSTYDNGILTPEQIIRHHNQTLGGWFLKVVPTNEINFE